MLMPMAVNKTHQFCKPREKTSWILFLVDCKIEHRSLPKSPGQQRLPILSTGTKRVLAEEPFWAAPLFCTRNMCRLGVGPFFCARRRVPIHSDFFVADHRTVCRLGAFAIAVAWTHRRVYDHSWCRMVPRQRMIVRLTSECLALCCFGTQLAFYLCLHWCGCPRHRWCFIGSCHASLRGTLISVVLLSRKKRRSGTKKLTAEPQQHYNSFSCRNFP